jgi:hypothetical protein
LLGLLLLGRAAGLSLMLDGRSAALGRLSLLTSLALTLAGAVGLSALSALPLRIRSSPLILLSLSLPILTLSLRTAFLAGSRLSR